MLEQRLGGFECWFGDHTNQVVDPNFASDFFVESSNTFGGDQFSGRMRIDDDRISASQHADGVAGDRWQRVGDWRDRANDAERCSFDDG